MRRSSFQNFRSFVNTAGKKEELNFGLCGSDQVNRAQSFVQRIRDSVPPGTMQQHPLLGEMEGGGGGGNALCWLSCKNWFWLGRNGMTIPSLLQSEGFGNVLETAARRTLAEHVNHMKVK